MAIVTFYNGDPKDAPKTTMPARLGANAIITCKNRLLLEKRSDSDVWGLVGGGCKKWETGRQAIAREVYEELGLRIAPERFRKLAVYDNPWPDRRLPGRQHLAHGDRGVRAGIGRRTGNAHQQRIQGPSLFQPGGNRGHPNRNHPQGYRGGLVLQRGKCPRL